MIRFIVLSLLAVILIGVLGGTALSFAAIAIGGLLLLALSSIFGHHDSDHDTDHDVDHDADHDGDHDHDHEHDHEDHLDGSPSLLSPKVMYAFITGFGAVGFILKNQGFSTLTASLWGAGIGIIIGIAAFLALAVFYKQQANSLVRSNELIGKTGVLTSDIALNGSGDIAIEGQYYLAQVANGEPIPKNTVVRVIESVGGTLVVERY